MSGTAVHLVDGADARLRSERLRQLVRDLVGDDDRELVVDEWRGDDYELGQVVDSARTMPFLSDRRIVVAAGIDRFDPDVLTLLVDYLADPADTAVLVLEWAGGRVPKKLTDAVKASGVRHQTGVANTPRARKDWLAECVGASGIELDRQAAAFLERHVGEDVGRVPGLVDTLVGAFGPGAKLSVSDLGPFVGEAGGIPPWDLTDPIDSGDIAAALAALERMLSGGDRHPLQVLTSLHNHYERALRLDGAGIADERAAAELLGDRGSTFRAKKSLGLARRLGPAGLDRIYELLAEADFGLRGGSGLDARHVLEVAVARLAQTSGRRRAEGSRSVS